MPGTAQAATASAAALIRSRTISLIIMGTSVPGFSYGCPRTPNRDSNPRGRTVLPFPGTRFVRRSCAMGASLEPDFGATAADYATHRAGFPDSFFARLAALGIGVGGQQLVDVGTGTGTLARGFARRGCRVIGIDPKEAMLAQARRFEPAAA